MSPAGSPLAGIPSPRWAESGARMVPHHSPSFPLPFPAAGLCSQPTAARMRRVEGLVLPAEGRSPPGSCFAEHRRRGGRELNSPSLMGPYCIAWGKRVGACVCASLCHDVAPQILFLRGKASLRDSCFGFGSLCSCHISQLHQLCTFSEKLFLTQITSQSWCAEQIYTPPVPEHSQSWRVEVGTWE